MMRFTSLTMAIAASACLTTGAAAQVAWHPAGPNGWTDDFDNYDDNSFIIAPTIGGSPVIVGWEEWDGGTTTQTKTRTTANGAAVRSAPHSIWVRSASDTIFQMNGNGPTGNGPYTSGQWEMIAWIYKPITTTGHVMDIPSWFLMQDIYNHGGPYDWSVQMQMNPLTGNYVADTATTTYVGPIITDQWVEIKVEIDLDADEVTLSYGGSPVGPKYAWNGGVSGFGGGANAIGALDLFADGQMNPQSRVYYDDLVFQAGTGGCNSNAFTYCTAGTSVAGCQALIASSGTSSATQPTGFNVTATGVEAGKNGLVFYSLGAAQAIPWNGGTSFRCFAGPNLGRGSLQGSGGVGPCDGTYGEDINARWTAKPNHNPGSGATVRAQWWYRDSGNPGNTSFSDALEWTVCP